MTFPATIYVESNGTTHGASDTDQRGTRETVRTVNGRPVALAGTWYGSQMSYRPYLAAVQVAAGLAASAESS